MKKIIRILFVCLFFIALIFIGKNVLKDGKEREYIKSDKYYDCLLYTSPSPRD